MTTLLERSRLRPALASVRGMPLTKRSAGFLREHSTAVTVVLLMLAAGATRLYNLEQYPGLYIDEGFYTSQAWSLQTKGELSPTTYIYDHPWFGWMFTAMYFVLTGGLYWRDDLTVMAGREFMVICAMATAALLFVLARRLGLSRFFAVVASLLWILSPLAISFSRLVLLDNIAVPFILAAMVLALSPSRRAWALAGSGLCFALAFWVKEVSFLAVFGLALMAWQNLRGSRNSIVSQLKMWSVYVVLCLGYPGYALLKGELLPGPGHVSWLEGQVLFQLVRRGGSGNILDPNSLAYGTINIGWLPLDYWLPWAGFGAMIIVLAAGWFSRGPLRKLLGPAIVLGVQIAMFFRSSGYIPFPMIIMLMPFFALLLGGVLAAFWPDRERFRVRGRQRTRAVAGTLVVLALPTAFVLGGGATAWKNTYTYEATARQTDSQRQVVDWARHNLAPGDIVVTEAEVWLDVLIRSGLPQRNVVMTYKIDADPEIRQQIGDPMQVVTHVIVKRDTLKRDARSESYPSVLGLADMAELVTTFGLPNDDNEWLVMRVAR